MTTATQAFVTVLIPGLVISIVTAIVTVRLSIRQFQSQKWWERKAEAYSEIMEQLTLLDISYGRLYEDAISMREMRKEERKPLLTEHSIAKDRVRRAAAAGSYIVSGEASLALNELVKEFDKRVPGEHWADEIGRHLQSTRASIAKLRRSAKLDLSRR